MSNEFVFIDKDNIFNHTTTIKQDYGGTGFNTFTKGDIMYSNSDNILTKLNIGNDLSILSINNSMPSWETINAIKANKLNRLLTDTTDNNNEYGIDIFNNEFYQFNVNSIQSIITSSYSNLSSYKTTVNFSSTITNGLANFNNFSIINTDYNSYINYNIVHIERSTDSVDLYTDYIINNSGLLIKYNLTNDNNSENLHLSTKLLTQENTIKTSIRFTPINYIYTCVKNQQDKNKIFIYLDDDIHNSSTLPNNTTDFIIKDINTNYIYTITNVSYTSNCITLTIDNSVVNLNNRSISLTYTKNTTDIKNSKGSLTNLVNKYIINTFVITKSSSDYLIDGIKQKALVLNTNYTYKFYNSTGETTIFNIVDITNSNTDLLSTYTETQLYKKGLYINEVNKEITFKPTKSGTYYYYFNSTVDGSVIYISNDAVTNEYTDDFVNTTIPTLEDKFVDIDNKNIELYFNKSVHNINHIIQKTHFSCSSSSSTINSSIIDTFIYNDTTLTINFVNSNGTHSYSDIISIQYISEQQLFTFNNTTNIDNIVLVDYTSPSIESIQIINSTNTTDTTYTDFSTLIILYPNEIYTFIITFNEPIQDLITYTTTLSDSNLVSGFSNGTGLLGTVDKKKYTITSFTTGTITSAYTITLTLNDVRDYFNNLISANTIGFNVKELWNNPTVTVNSGTYFSEGTRLLELSHSNYPNGFPTQNLYGFSDYNGTDGDVDDMVFFDEHGHCIRLNSDYFYKNTTGSFGTGNFWQDSKSFICSMSYESNLTISVSGLTGDYKIPFYAVNYYGWVPSQAPSGSTEPVYITSNPVGAFTQDGSQGTGHISWTGHNNPNHTGNNTLYRYMMGNGTFTFNMARATALWCFPDKLPVNSTHAYTNQPSN